MSSTPHPPVSDPASLRARLEGELVVLEPLGEEHADGLGEAARDGEDLFRWLFADLARPDQLEAWLETSIAAARAKREVPFAILTRSDGQVQGSTRFMEIRLEHRRVEIGWTWLRRSAWSTGVNVETKLLLLGHAFEQVRCRRVEFKTDARNERSRGALTALGAAFEGTMRKHMVLPGGDSRDSAYYSVIDSEWPELRKRLRQRLRGARKP